MKKHFDIFISYRRKDSEGKVSGRDIAARIKSAFENKEKINYYYRLKTEITTMFYENE